MANKPIRIEPECKSKCRSKLDADHLIAAVTKGTDEESVHFLALSGICCQPGKVSDKLGRTVLHLASSLGKRRVVEWLLRFKEAAINAKDHESGYSALHRSLFYGQIHVADYLIESGANLALTDNEGLTPIDHSMKDQPRYLGLEASNPCDVYVWGSNSNYNLGIGNHHRSAPDVLDFFRKENVYCRSVNLQKFHSAFLSGSGRVYTCGHGRGGRLGHGHAESQLTPKLVNHLANHTVQSVALGVDHSMFLSSSGTVFTCGLNQHLQLGQHPPPEESLTPQPIFLLVKTSRSASLPPAKGISAARYHSLFYTKSQVYTWGLNGGQLGHLKGEKTFSTPKLVSALNKKDFAIKMVVSSDGAVIILGESGEIFALHEYQTRKIFRHNDVAKIEVIGGHLDPSVMSGTSSDLGSKITDRGGQDLRVIILSNQGKLSVWEENQGAQIFSCVFNLGREILVQDVALNKTGLLLISKDGLGYTGTYQGRKERSTSPILKGKYSGLSEMEKFVSKHPVEVIKLKRISGIYRGCSCATDSKGQNFSILQMLPNLSLLDIPEVEASKMRQDLKTFFEETNELDQLSDVIFVVKGQRFAAHKFIVASISDKLAKEVVALGENGEVEIADVEPELFREILMFAYVKTCNLLTPGPCAIKLDIIQDQKQPDANGTDHDIQNGNRIDFDPAKTSAFAVHKKNKKKMQKLGSQSLPEKQKSPDNLITLAQENAKCLGVHGLVKALENFEINDGIIGLKNKRTLPRSTLQFSRKSFPELHDVIIHCDDQVQVPAHRCVLAARLEYFKSMFSLGWSETRKGQTLSLSMPSKVVKVLLDFLYRDEADGIQTSDDLELISSVLIVADQFLIPRLIQICERQLSQNLSLKNAAEILQFAFDYNAKQLQGSAMQFISQNMASFLEARSLSVLSEENLKKLSQYHQSSIPGMQKRRITPYSLSPSQDDITNFLGHSPLHVETLFEEESLISNGTRNAQNGSSSKKKKRRNSSGDDFQPRGRNLSSSSLSSMLSDSSSDNDIPNKGSSETSLFHDDFEFEEKCAIAETPAAPYVEDPLHNHNQSSEQFLSDFFATKSQPTESNIFGKRFVKKSQKERKKETLETCSNSTPANEVKASKKVWSGWGHKPVVLEPTEEDSPSPTFTEIMRLQSQTDLNASPNFKKSSRPKKASWKQLSLTDEEISTASSNMAERQSSNPWTKMTLYPSQTPPAAAVIRESKNDFKNILSDQAKQRESLYRAKSKSLSILQLEEQAIQELSEFYNAKGTFDEEVVVTRVDHAPMATPIWERRKN